MLAFIRRLLRPRPVMLSARALGQDQHLPWWQAGSVPAVLTVLSLGETDGERRQILMDCADMARTDHLRMRLAEDRRARLEEELAQARVELDRLERRAAGNGRRPVLVSRND